MIKQAALVLGLMALAACADKAPVTANQMPDEPAVAMIAKGIAMPAGYKVDPARTLIFGGSAGAGLAVGQKVALAVRPAAIELARESAGAVNAITGQVTDIAFRGDASLVRLAAPSGAMLRASAPRELLARLAVERGETVVARFAPSALRVLTQ